MTFQRALLFSFALSAGALGCGRDRTHQNANGNARPIEGTSDTTPAAPTPTPVAPTPAAPSPSPSGTVTPGSTGSTDTPSATAPSGTPSSTDTAPSGTPRSTDTAPNGNTDMQRKGNSPNGATSDTPPRAPN
jgi:hypothetical protein